MQLNNINLIQDKKKTSVGKLVLDLSEYVSNIKPVAKKLPLKKGKAPYLNVRH